MSLAQTSSYLNNDANRGVDEVFKLLSDWDLLELHDTFKENGIGISALKCLKESDIKELIPKIGYRYLFCSKLEEWRRTQCVSMQTETVTRTAIKRSHSEDLSSGAVGNPPASIVKIEEPQITESFATNNVQNSGCNESYISNASFVIIKNEFSVFEWLSHDADGQCILDSYNIYNCLSVEQRKSVLKIIARCLADLAVPKSVAVFEQVSMQLMELFPSEHFTSNDLLRWCTQIENGIDPDTPDTNNEIFDDIDSPGQMSTNSEGNDLRNLLSKWKLECVYNKCQEEGITIEDLKNMTERHCELLLVKDFRLNILIRFENALKQWQEIRTKYDDMENIRADENASKINVERILLSNGDGKKILQNYKKTKILNDSCRQLIVKLIISHLFQNDTKMTVKVAENIADQVVELFNTETKEMYFLKQYGKAPLGKIYSKYFNHMRSLRLAGVVQKREYLPEKVTMEPETNIEDHLQAIADDNCSWAEIEMHYKATTKQRVIHIQNAATITEITSKYVHYKRPLGYKLIDMDFTTAFPNATNFMIKFPIESEKLLNLIRRKVKDPQSINLCSNLHTTMNERGLHTATLYLLHAVLVPTNFSSKLQDGKSVLCRSSIKQSQNSFLQCGVTPSKLNEIFGELQENKEPIEPLILVTPSILNPLDVSVYFDGTIYKFINILSAVDTCFKIYSLFNLKYPTHSILFWTFIQKHYYGLNKKSDKQSPKILSLINDLQCLT